MSEFCLVIVKLKWIHFASRWNFAFWKITISKYLSRSSYLSQWLKFEVVFHESKAFCRPLLNLNPLTVSAPCRNREPLKINLRVESSRVSNSKPTSSFCFYLFLFSSSSLCVLIFFPCFPFRGILFSKIIHAVNKSF